MRLVIDGQRLTAERTGVGRCLECLLHQWAATGWPLPDVQLVLRDEAGLCRIPEAPGLTTRVIGHNWPGLVWETWGLGRFLRKEDILFAPANLVPPTWTGRTVLMLFDTLIWSVPESFPRSVRWRFGWRYRMASRRASRIVVPSRSTAEDVQTHLNVPPERIRLAHPAPDPGFRPHPSDSPLIRQARMTVGDAPYFLFVGKRSRRRNVPALLDSWTRHRVDHPDSRLVFVGPHGGEPPLPREDAGIIEAGHVDEPTLQGLLAGAEALLYPSDYEGFGLPVVEAMASGCPVVTLRNSALVESGGDAVYSLESADAVSLGIALSRLRNDRGLRNALVARGLAHVRRFRVDTYAAAVAEVIREVAAGGSLSRPHFNVPGSGRSDASVR